MDKETTADEVSRLRWQVEMLSRSGKLNGEPHRNRAFVFSEFVSRECVCGPSFEIAAENLHRAWSDWHRGRFGDEQDCGGPSVIGKIIRVLLPGVYRLTSSKNGSHTSNYRGITLKRGRKLVATELDSPSPVPAAPVQAPKESLFQVDPDYNPDRDCILEVHPEARIESNRVGLTVYDYWVNLIPGGESPPMPHARSESKAWELAASVVFKDQDQESPNA